ncbi:hypothetical protein IMAU60212_01698 [Lactobacillus helveticus]|uniref:restriction endonuclease subunit S n=1 Tax=Lactobacillus helveticus TaxID=1587 RepID=UPI00156295EA|nr:restriction endonuclease subunit S [Lactobacillus helveticus]NRO41536.1 hypothetical protein [Lactobacillus helveticus]
MNKKEVKKAPALRFKGFTNDWEERKLGEVATFLNGRAYKQDELLDSGKYKVLRVGNFYTNDSWYYSNMELGDKYYVDKGDLVYTWSATFGPHIWSGEKVIYHYHIWKVELSKFLDRNFTFQLLEADKARLLSSTNGSTMIHVTKRDMESKIVSIPNIDEQKQIGSFLKQLDNTIALHQRKLDLLKEQKKGYLQKMFPKNGAKVPELRFAGFTDDWEERKLGSLTTVVRGASPRPIQDPKWFDKESDIGWLRIADVTEQNGRIYHLEQHISKLGQEKTRVLTEPHLLLSIAATVGKPVVNYVKTGVHDGFLIFLNPTFEREFMFQWLEMFRPKWQKYGQPGSQVNLNSELVRNQKIVLPNYKEQQKIGSFFKQLDNTIALHQRKLDLLKEQKKGFLQKMFV